MKKLLFVVCSMFVIVGLVACDGEETSGKEVNGVESSGGENNVEDMGESTEADESTEKSKEINEVVADNDNVKATLTSVEYIEDKDWDEEKYEIKFEVENKMEDTIEVQAREVSVDGKMVDESMLMMSQEVSSGKIADAVLTIESFNEDELPDMEEDLEMILNIFSWEDMEQEENIDVKIEF